MIVVYLGPSLSLEKAKAILDADYRPPISRGDIKKAVKDGAKIIGIIDGIFYNQTAVAHKELLDVLKKKVKIVGGSSMGALRASELDSFGMIGVGRIYECYKTGKITADDEVAVTYNPVTGAQISEPLVNIRHQLKGAVNAGFLSEAERSGIIKISSAIYYPERKYPPILKKAVEEGVLSNEKAISLKDYIDKHPLNLKEEDAIKTLEKIKEIQKIS
jgi:hypothetical protein